MTGNDASTKSLPAKQKGNGQFRKGKSGNPTGRPKGSLSKTTRFLQILTPDRQKKALRVLDAALRDAESGDKESRKLVLTLLQPFIKREAETEGGGSKRPTININVGVAEGRKPIEVQATEVEDV